MKKKITTDIRDLNKSQTFAQNSIPAPSVEKEAVKFQIKDPLSDQAVGVE